ncbi:MAG: hypothetical protein ABUJ98_15910 [Hyphomicrobium sp.]|jgi:hypothetical protein
MTTPCNCACAEARGKVEAVVISLRVMRAGLEALEEQIDQMLATAETELKQARPPFAQRSVFRWRAAHNRLAGNLPFAGDDVELTYSGSNIVTLASRGRRMFNNVAVSISASVVLVGSVVATKFETLLTSLGRAADLR